MEAAFGGHAERGKSVLVLVMEWCWKLSIPQTIQEIAREPKSGRDFKTVLMGERG